MTSAVPTGKKPALCRYFMSTGSCVYGDECQFLHENPVAFQQQSQKNVNPLFTGPNQPNGPINGPANTGMSDQMGSNGDQYFNATFSAAESHVPDFQPFSQRQKPPAPISRQPRSNTVGAGPGTSSVGGVPGTMIPAGALMTSSPMVPASNSSPMSQSMAQPSLMSQSMAQPSPMSQSMTQPSPMSQPMSQPSPMSQPMSQPSLMSQSMAQPSPMSQPMSQPSPMSQPMSQPSPMSQPMSQSSPMSQPMSQPSPMSQPMSQASQMPSPFTNAITPNKVPISQSTPLPPPHVAPQGLPASMPPQNGPVSMMNGQMPPNMKQFIGGGGFDHRNGPAFDNRNGPAFDNRNSGGFDNRSMMGFDSRNGSGIDSSITNDFSALNLSVPAPTKQGTNPYVGEFIPKSLSHSSSSPNFSSFNTSQPPPGTLPNSTAPANHMVAGLSVNSTASPSHSPRLSPANSPLMMRRNGSPVTPLRNKAHPASTIQENVGGTTYFYNAEDFTTQREGIALPNFSMYQGQPPHIAHMKVKSNMPQFFMPDELKMEILNKNALTMAQIDLSHNIDIPSEVDTYQNLFPLESPPDNPHQKSKTFGYATTCYKALNTKDGLTYCLRRIHGFRLVNTKCMTLVDMWKKMYHPNIVQLREVFTTKAFGDHSIVFVYDFFPGSETLLSRHFSQSPIQMNGFNGTIPTDTPSRPFVSGGKGSSSAPRQHAGLLPESLIWAYVVQLSSSLRAIHAAGLSCRTLDPSKIIIYSKSRLRLNCCGIFDVLTYDNNQSNPMALTPHYQQEDLVSLGKVVLALACNNVMAIQRENLQTSMELVARNYSADLKNLILYLLSNQSRPRSINDIMPMIGARFYTQLDSAQLRTDVIENEMSKEVENGRLFRLLCKLGVTNERPEFNLDPQWSETGDRYMLKLFRDYVFHQVDENGAPWVDMSHVVQCLNKLDAASPEKISLMSRDEQNVLVVSYAELKQNIDNAFSDILNVTRQSAIS